KDDVNERIPHVGGASYRLNVWRPGQCRDKWLGNLRLQKLRAARPFGVDHDLWIGNVGNCVERGLTNRIEANDNARSNQNQNEESETDYSSNDVADHYLRRSGLHISTCTRSR